MATKLTAGRKARLTLARQVAGKMARLCNRIGLLENSPGNDQRFEAVQKTAGELLPLLIELRHFARPCPQCGAINSDHQP